MATQGRSGGQKTGGKKKGTPNKVTKEAREIFKDIMEGEISNVKDALDKIRAKSPFNYILCFSKLAPYFMPKQLDVKTDGEKIQAPVIQILPFNEAE
jgi:hypothetical protein